MIKTNTRPRTKPLPIIKFVIAPRLSEKSKHDQKEQKNIATIPWHIFRSLNKGQQEAVCYKLETIVRGLQLAGWQPGKDRPGHIESKKFRQTMEAIHKRLLKAESLMEDIDTDFFGSLVQQHASRPGDLDIARRFPNDLPRITEMLGKELKTKTRLFRTRGEVPAMVAGAVSEILQENKINPTLTPQGPWEKLINIVIKAATGKSIPFDSVQNAMRTARCKFVVKI